MSDIPWCFQEDLAAGYALSGFIETTYGYQGTLTLIGSGSSVYGDDIISLKLEVIYESTSIFHIRITDSDESRWEIPQTVISRKTSAEITKTITQLYTFEYHASPFTFEITRKSDGVLLFSNTESFVFKDQYIEIKTNYNKNAKTFGIGESTRLNHALNTDDTYTLWNADIAALVMNENLYGSFPFYLQMLEGKASGVMLLNSNGMDVQLKTSSVKFTVIGGIIDLYVFVGPTPTEVIQQLTSIVGYPAMVPYWSLGLHNCKYGYTSLSEIKEVVTNYSLAGKILVFKYRIHRKLIICCL